jgi:bifunctional non-homologous end joining protein LigD
MSLKEYQRKRDFAVTPEPRHVRARKRSGGERRFVVQKHAASRLHYDLRLELGGTLKSWAVPKGFPLRKGEKHLAVEVEDHPLSYIDFEGPIPQGEYGGGTVMVWDKGCYEPEVKTPLKSLKEGKLHFTLQGKKLHGEWYLVRLREDRQWLLIRAGEDMPALSRKQENSSALSSRSMRQLAQAESFETKGRLARVPAPAKKARAKKLAGKRRALPSFVPPMKAKLVVEPPVDEGWIFEIKFDGFRALARVDGGSVSLTSRTKNDMTSKFPDIVHELESLALPDCLLDGEIVALDGKGRSSFQSLQAYDIKKEKVVLCYYGFDVLHLAGRDVTGLPLTERKQLLQEMLPPSDTIRYSASLEGEVKRLLKNAQKLGLEGLIGKQADSPYEPGLRTGKWVKVKLQQEQEFIIGGYTAPQGSRQHLGALILGVFAEGKLHCVGKVGTGFDAKLLRALHAKMQPLIRKKCPFANLPADSRGRWGQDISKEDMRRCTWLAPRLVCQVKFAEWTEDQRLRQPVFTGMREDKPALEVIREIPSHS